MEPQSTDRNLELLLTLYSIGRRTLYLDYMAGFKLLVEWIGPVTYSHQHYPLIAWYHSNYEIDRLAAILEIPPEVVLKVLERINWNV